MVFPGKISPPYGTPWSQAPSLCVCHCGSKVDRWGISAPLFEHGGITITWPSWGEKKDLAWNIMWINMFAPSRTLLHTYDRHDDDRHDDDRHDDDDDDDHHHHHHHQNHHLYLHEGSKFATPSEQYVDWGNTTIYISMRDQNSPPPMNNMLTGVITSTLSSWRVKIRHPVWTICWLHGVITSTLSS